MPTSVLFDLQPTPDSSSGQRLRLRSEERRSTQICYLTSKLRADTRYLFYRATENGRPSRPGRYSRWHWHAPLRNWVHKKIPGCAVELNTQNCTWFGSLISLITTMSIREAMPPPNHPPGALPLDLAGGLPFPRPPVPPPPNPGYATGSKAAYRSVCLS